MKAVQVYCDWADVNVVRSRGTGSREHALDGTVPWYDADPEHLSQSTLLVSEEHPTLCQYLCPKHLHQWHAVPARFLSVSVIWCGEFLGFLFLNFVVNNLNLMCSVHVSCVCTVLLIYCGLSWPRSTDIIFLCFSYVIVLWVFTLMESIRILTLISVIAIIYSCKPIN